MSLTVEFVWNTLPQEQVTVAGPYSGWMSFFMGKFSLWPRPGRPWRS